MLLHTLEITAFGPFAETERVDFDALGDTGLFLLTGPTGAGKTSLLDAVCFALFGSVPGAREQAARLRSDHAAEGVAPRVSLELTVGDRRLRLVRTPTWFAPRRRGTGDPIKRNPEVTLAQLRDGEWEPLSSRIPEVADQVQTWLGMDVHQFTQVAMLPQGAFAQFLRSGAEERKKVLERLFSTSRFRDIESWLVENRRGCKARSAEALADLRAGVDRVLGAAGAIGTDACLAGPGEEPADWPRWAARLAAELTALDEQATALRDTTAAVARTRAEAAESGRALHALQARADQAHRWLEALAEGQARADREAERLDAALRAGAVQAHLERLDTADASLRRRRDLLAAATRRAAALDVEVPDPADGPENQLAFAEHVCRTIQKLTHDAELLSALHADHQAAALDLEEARRAHDVAQAEVRLARQRVAAGPAERSRLDQRLTAARELAAQEARWGAELVRVRRVHAAAEALPPLRRRQEAAVVVRDQAFAALNTAFETLNDVRQARLDSAAAWLASRLREGHACDVCGSVEHPAPHPAADDAPDEHDEQRARAGLDQARETKQTADDALGAIREQVAHRESESGGLAADEARDELDACEQRLLEARAAAREVTAVEAELVTLDAQLHADREVMETASVRATTLAERLTALQAQQEARVAELTEAVGPDLDVQAHVASVHRREEAASAVTAALRETVAATQEHHTATLAATAAATTAGFAGPQEAREAVLPAVDVETLRTSAQEQRDRHRRAQDTLGDPEVDSASALPRPDLVALAAALTSAREEAAASERLASVISAKAADVTRLAEEVADACARWLPLCERAAVADAMASLVTGTSADNATQVSLSAFVLAARLQQVVDAANERFVPMTSGRYTLEHTMRRSAGDRRVAGGGLGLLVRDSWTGESRDPKTLSGGETFQASLALALGLSDVVTHEVGGVELRTLFVDEGFGSLDADSLDEVMDVLDGLRAGGRRVGVVSHVDMLRERIPSQVRLVKTPTGSRVEQPTA